MKRSNLASFYFLWHVIFREDFSYLWMTSQNYFIPYEICQYSQQLSRDFQAANQVTGKWRAVLKWFLVQLAYSGIRSTPACAFAFASGSRSILLLSKASKKLKMASGGMVLIKYLLFFFNFIFWVSMIFLSWPVVLTWTVVKSMLYISPLHGA